MRPPSNKMQINTIDPKPFTRGVRRTCGVKGPSSNVSLSIIRSSPSLQIIPDPQPSCSGLSRMQLRNKGPQPSTSRAEHAELAQSSEIVPRNIAAPANPEQTSPPKMRYVIKQIENYKPAEATEATMVLEISPPPNGRVPLMVFSSMSRMEDGRLIAATRDKDYLRLFRRTKSIDNLTQTVIVKYNRGSGIPHLVPVLCGLTPRRDGIVLMEIFADEIKKNDKLREIAFCSFRGAADNIRNGFLTAMSNKGRNYYADNDDDDDDGVLAITNETCRELKRLIDPDNSVIGPYTKDDPRLREEISKTILRATSDLYQTADSFAQSERDSSQCCCPVCSAKWAEEAKRIGNETMKALCEKFVSVRRSFCPNDGPLRCNVKSINIVRNKLTKKKYMSVLNGAPYCDVYTFNENDTTNDAQSLNEYMRERRDVCKRPASSENPTNKRPRYFLRRDPNPYDASNPNENPSTNYTDVESNSMISDSGVSSDCGSESGNVPSFSQNRSNNTEYNTRDENEMGVHKTNKTSSAKQRTKRERKAPSRARSNICTRSATKKMTMESMQMSADPSPAADASRSANAPSPISDNHHASGESPEREQDLKDYYILHTIDERPIRLGYADVPNLISRYTSSSNNTETGNNLKSEQYVKTEDEMKAELSEVDIEMIDGDFKSENEFDDDDDIELDENEAIYARLITGYSKGWNLNGEDMSDEDGTDDEMICCDESHAHIFDMIDIDDETETKPMMETIEHRIGETESPELSFENTKFHVMHEMIPIDSGNYADFSFSDDDDDDCILFAINENTFTFPVPFDSSLVKTETETDNSSSHIPRHEETCENLRNNTASPCQGNDDVNALTCRGIIDERASNSRQNEEVLSTSRENPDVHWLTSCENSDVHLLTSCECHDSRLTTSSEYTEDCLSTSRERSGDCLSTLGQKPDTPLSTSRVYTDDSLSTSHQNSVTTLSTYCENPEGPLSTSHRTSMTTLPTTCENPEGPLLTAHQNSVTTLSKTCENPEDHLSSCRECSEDCLPTSGENPGSSLSTSRVHHEGSLSTRCEYPDAPFLTSCQNRFTPLSTSREYQGSLSTPREDQEGQMSTAREYSEGCMSKLHEMDPKRPMSTTCQNPDTPQSTPCEYPQGRFSASREYQEGRLPTFHEMDPKESMSTLCQNPDTPLSTSREYHQGSLPTPREYPDQHKMSTNLPTPPPSSSSPSTSFAVDRSVSTVADRPAKIINCTNCDPLENYVCPDCMKVPPMLMMMSDARSDDGISRYLSSQPLTSYSRRKVPRRRNFDSESSKQPFAKMEEELIILDENVQKTCQSVLEIEEDDEDVVFVGEVLPSTVGVDEATCGLKGHLEPSASSTLVIESIQSLQIVSQDITPAEPSDSGLSGTSLRNEGSAVVETEELKPKIEDEDDCVFVSEEPASSRPKRKFVKTIIIDDDDEGNAVAQPKPEDDDDDVMIIDDDSEDDWPAHIKSEDEKLFMPIKEDVEEENPSVIKFEDQVVVLKKEYAEDTKPPLKPELVFIADEEEAISIGTGDGSDFEIIQVTWEFPKDKEFCCFHCRHEAEKSFESVESLREHIDSSHSTVFECPLCNYSTVDRLNFPVHLVRGHAFEYLCDECGHLLKGDYSKVLHIHKRHLNLPLFICSVRGCHLSCRSLSELQNHLGKKHPIKAITYKWKKYKKNGT